MKYMRQLDGVRAIAILLVFTGHWFSWAWVPTSPIGGMGVNCFFVLSGFLITSILLQGRKASPKAAALKNFYIRRFLRIFPLYYGVLFFFVIIGYLPVVKTFLWDLSYCTNIYIFLHGSWPFSVSHLWSLSMEEQFYLVWPYLIFFVPSRFLAPSIIFAIILSPISRIILYSMHFSIPSITTFPLCSLDFLGFGGLLAYYRSYYPQVTWPLKKLRFYSIIAIILFFLTWMLRVKGYHNLFSDISFYSLEMIFLGYFIFRASEGFTGIAGKVLGFGPIVYIGKISYGLYVFHLIIGPIIKFKLLSLYPHLHLNELQWGAVYLTSNLAVASTSYFFYEKWFLNMKERFIKIE